MPKSPCTDCGNETDDRCLRACEECGNAYCLTCYGEHEGEVWCDYCYQQGKRLEVFTPGKETETIPCPNCNKKAIAENQMKRVRAEPMITLYRWRCAEPGGEYLSGLWGIRDETDDEKFKKDWDSKQNGG